MISLALERPVCHGGPQSPGETSGTGSSMRREGTNRRRRPRVRVSGRRPTIKLEGSMTRTFDAPKAWPGRSCYVGTASGWLLCLSWAMRLDDHGEHPLQVTICKRGKGKVELVDGDGSLSKPARGITLLEPGDWLMIQSEDHSELCEPRPSPLADDLPE